MKLTSHGIGRLFVFALLALGCAAGQRPQSESAARVKDSAPDKIAAQRAAVHGLDLEEENQRWGLEAARERRQKQDQKKLPVTENATVGTNPPVDVRQAPPPRVTP
jgi:hypothetical protein